MKRYNLSTKRLANVLAFDLLPRLAPHCPRWLGWYLGRFYIICYHHGR